MRAGFKRRKFNFSAGVFLAISLIIYCLLICFMALNLGVSQSGIKQLVSEYVQSVDIDTQYFDNFEDAGFSEKQCYGFLEGEEIRDCISEVMCERVEALFKNTADYKYTRDDCVEAVKTALTGFAEKESITLTDSQIEKLTQYTLDISGLTAMCSYDSPAAYRTSIFEDDTEKIEEYNQVFEVLKTLTSPIFPISLSIMYLVCICIACSVGWNDGKILLSVCNTITYPSFFLIATSIGYIFGASNNDVTSRYVFSVILFASLMSFAVGLLFEIIIYTLGKNAGFDKWLEKQKEKYRKGGKKDGKSSKRRTASKGSRSRRKEGNI